MDKRNYGMVPIKALFTQKYFESTDKVKMLQWSGNHWDDILYFPKDYQVGYITYGQGIFKQSDDIIDIKAGQFFFIHPGNLHSGKPNSYIGWSADVLVFKSEYVFEIYKELNNGELKLPVYEPIVMDVELSKKIFEHFKNVLNILEDKVLTPLSNEINLFFSIYELLSIPSSIKLSLNDLNSYQKEVQRAKDFIEQNYKDNFSLEDLSNYAYLSKFHLLRAFKKQVGITPGTYQIQLRLNEARKLIFKTKSLTEVALELGFTDQAHFTNTFKRYANGASPKELKKTAIFYNFNE